MTDDTLVSVSGYLHPRFMLFVLLQGGMMVLDMGKLLSLTLSISIPWILVLALAVIPTVNSPGAKTLLSSESSQFGLYHNRTGLKI
ncbi:hypothetical protein BDW42DRAFT_175012 [Aspergillus taichungensis]|uniref:Uncharacterized protein n=1 Tax=Aspergillus taichungensis TaxID=482145 RepID=A0A2J5HMC2_9EURO|nr:hypothetical protein BDW42DRAFT_175012 [Aspergillus taichungensis]